MVSDTPVNVNVASAVALGVTSPLAAIEGAWSARVTDTPEAAAALAAATVTEEIVVPELLLRGAEMSHAATLLPILVAIDTIGLCSAFVESSHVVGVGYIDALATPARRITGRFAVAEVHDDPPQKLELAATVMPKPDHAVPSNCAMLLTAVSPAVANRPPTTRRSL